MRNCTLYANERGEDGWECPDPWPGPADGDGGGIRGSGFCVDCITWGPDGGTEPDPLLLDPLNYDFRVSSGSPAIDDGDPGLETSPGETDFAGRPRVLCGRVDRGAFEFAGDYDCDRAVGLTDHAGWQDCVTGSDLGPYASGCESFDYNTDADVDLRDQADWQNAFGL